MRLPSGDREVVGVVAGGTEVAVGSTVGVGVGTAVAVGAGVGVAGIAVGVGGGLLLVLGGVVAGALMLL